MKLGPMRARAWVQSALRATSHGMTYPEKGARVGSVAAGAFGRGTGSPGGAVDRAESFSCGPRVRRVR